MASERNNAFRNKVLQALTREWSSTGTVALQVNAAAYAAQQSLMSLMKDGLVQGARRKSDRQRVWRLPANTSFAVSVG